MQCSEFVLGVVTMYSSYVQGVQKMYYNCILECSDSVF